MRPVQLQCGLGLRLLCSGSCSTSAPKPHVALPPHAERALRATRQRSGGGAIRQPICGLTCRVAQPSDSLTLESSDEPQQAPRKPPRRVKGSAAKKPEPPGLSDIAAAGAASPTDRQALAFAREYELEAQDETDDASYAGRMGQAMFHGPSGRVGCYAQNTYPKSKLRRRRKLAQLRAQLDEAQLMKPILVRPGFAALSNTVQPADGLRYEPARGAAEKVAVASTPRSDEAAEQAAPASEPSPSRSPAAKVPPSAPPKAATKPVGASSNVVDFSAASKMSPGYAVRCPQGVVLPVLPNIMAVTGKIGINEMEALASQRVLTSVLTLELPKQLHSVSLEKDPKYCKRSIQFKAAALARLITRAEQRHSPSYTILLQSPAQTLQPVAQLIAAWLHWSGQMSIQEACDRAGALCGCHVPRSLMEKANEHLYESAISRRKSQYLVWPHGAQHSAKVAGDIVGSWQKEVSMHLVTPDETELLGLDAGNWVLRLPDDLKPGTYSYKYVIDGNWRVDWSQPHQHDGHSFCNNLFTVAANKPLLAAVPEDKLRIIRKEFTAMALRVKLSLGPKLLAGR